MRDLMVLGSLAVILIATLVPAPGAPIADGWNLVPFADLMRGAGSRYATRLALEDIVANVLLFVPLGLATAARFRLGLVRAVAVGIVISISVEAAQGLIAGRASDITDVLMNGVGVAVGWVVWRLVDDPARFSPGRPE